MKRIFLFAAGAILVAAIGVYWFQQWQAFARRLAEWEAERRDDVPPPVLAKTFQWERAELTLGEFAELVAARSGLTAEIDVGSTFQGATRSGVLVESEGEGLLPERKWKSKLQNLKVSVPSGEFSLDQLLDLVLSPSALVADIRGRKIVITHAVNSDRGRQRTVVYPVPQPKPAGMNETDWQQLIAANIDGHAVQTPGAIIVVATAAQQKRARVVIETICALRAGGSEAVTIPSPEPGSTEERIWSELSKGTTVDFVEQPLKDVILYLTELHHIPLILRADKLREASVAVDTPITKTLRDVSLRSGLHLILKDLELTFAVRDQALLITTPEDAEAQRRTVAYSLDRLTALGAIVDLDEFEKVMASTIEPGSWRAFGGPGLVHRADGKWLIIQQTNEILGRVNSLFNTLQQMLADEGHVASRSIVPAEAAEQALREGLQRPLTVQFDGVPLKDAAAYIAEELKIPIILSVRKVEEASISPGTSITYQAKAIPARVALEEMLKPIRLTFVVRDEVLQITTPEDSESQLVTRVYDTRAILTRMSADRLHELTLENIRPKSWSDGKSGGWNLYRGLLVVTQTDEIHEQIERLVEKITASSGEAM